MEDNTTLYDLLCEGTEVGELVDAVEKGKVLIFDKYGRDNQIPNMEDKAELLAKLGLHQAMIREKKLPVSMRSDDCNMYWQADWRFLLDCGGDLQPILARAWIIGKPDKKANSTSTKFTKKTGSEKALVRHAPSTNEQERVRKLAIPFIQRGLLNQKQIVKEIMDNHNPTISRGLVAKCVTKQCDAMGRGALVINRKKA